MKIKILSIFVLLIIIISLLLYGCEKEEIDIYEGRRCIVCDGQATTGIVGTRAMCTALNRNYNSSHFKEGASYVGTVYFCDECYSSHFIGTVTGPFFQ